MQSLLTSSAITGAWSRSPENDFSYRLTSGDAVYALYDGLPDVPTCRTAEGVWALQRSGVWKPKTQVWRQGADEGVANLWWGASHPTLELKDGRRVSWRYNFLRTAFVLHDGKGTDLIVFHSIQAPWSRSNQPGHSAATMEYKTPAETLPDAALLALAGWYSLMPGLTNRACTNASTG
jgi:hypothetical protein